jgi:GH24 family phage-related lysozyme (muramidase)
MDSVQKCPKPLSKLNTKDYSGCCDEFGDITNGGTAGLVTRRKAEMDIFRNSVYNSNH